MLDSNIETESLQVRTFESWTEVKSSRKNRRTENSDKHQRVTQQQPEDTARETEPSVKKLHKENSDDKRY